MRSALTSHPASPPASSRNSFYFPPPLFDQTPCGGSLRCFRLTAAASAASTTVMRAGSEAGAACRWHQALGVQHTSATRAGQWQHLCLCTRAHFVLGSRGCAGGVLLLGHEGLSLSWHFLLLSASKEEVMELESAESHTEQVLCFNGSALRSVVTLSDFWSPASTPWLWQLSICFLGREWFLVSSEW